MIMVEDLSCDHYAFGKQLTVRNCIACGVHTCEVCVANHMTWHLHMKLGISTGPTPYNHQPQFLWSEIELLKAKVREIQVSNIQTALVDGLAVIKKEVMALIPTRRELINMLRKPTFTPLEEAKEEQTQKPEEDLKEERKKRIVFTRTED